MNTSTAVPSLMFMTLGVVFVIALVFFIWHMRKRSNRRPMEGIRERRQDEMERGVPPRKE